jgi:Fe-S cluster assembly protein SufD
MQAEPSDSKAYYLEVFQEKTQLSEDFLSATRQQALQSFAHLGFPTTRHEEWKYTNLQPFVRQPLQFAEPGMLSSAALDSHLILPDFEANVLVFLNGHYQATHSRIISPQIQLLSFAEALEYQHEAVQQLVNTHFARYADYQEQAMVALNTAFASSGSIVYVPDKVSIEHPVLLYFITQSTSPSLNMPRNLVVAGIQSQVTLMEIHKGHNQELALTNMVTEISLAEGARMHYYKLQQGDEKDAYIGLTEVYQRRDSYFSAHTLSLSGSFVRNNLHLVLDAENCEAHMYGLYLLKDRQFLDNHTLADHRKPHSHSNELYKGILDGRSIGVFNGKIFVRKDAQKTNAYQSSRNVLLSPEATVNAKPQLEIFADDVRCSHGAAVGQLDGNLLFYLKARGIPEDKAKTLLMLAYANEVLETIHIPELKDYLERAIEEKLNPAAL